MKASHSFPFPVCDFSSNAMHKSWVNRKIIIGGNCHNQKEFFLYGNLCWKIAIIIFIPTKFCPATKQNIWSTKVKDKTRRDKIASVFVKCANVFVRKAKSISLNCKIYLAQFPNAERQKSNTIYFVSHSYWQGDKKTKIFLVVSCFVTQSVILSPS